MAKILPSEDNSILALDIGTRTVIGIVALMESGKLRIAAQHIMEHQSRSMFDGQIHDIPKVADTVLEVKRTLEKKVGFKLTRAAIAAAGRALITKHSRTEMEIDDSHEIDNSLVNSLEIACIRNAHEELDPSAMESSETYYCVGYSVVKYYLNNYPITNLVGHRGALIGADVLATFLPESVVNGLYSVLRRVDLEPVNLTLEPIAAIEVAIPEGLRHLNLALVDVGAGTSDIAITRKGSVVSYGMVPKAGDEITEAISEAFLVDFNEAEKIKRALEKDGAIVYKDILGIENTTTTAEVAAAIEPVLDRLALEVAETIIKLNGGETPKTVFCVGGGSQIPNFTCKLAGHLGIDFQKVAIRGREAVQNLVVDEAGLEGPEGVTVVGIATVAIKKLGQDFVTIKVDGKEFSLFNARDLTVSNALSMVEFNPRDLIGHNGRDLKFSLNGKPEVVYGGLAKPAEIYINGERVNLKALIKEGDEITVLKAADGEDARAYARDFMASQDGSSMCGVLELDILINEEPATPDNEIKSGDRLEIKTVKTARELIEGEDLTDSTIQVNDADAAQYYELKDGDDVKLCKKNDAGKESAVINSNEVEPLHHEKTTFVTVNGSEINLEGNKQNIFVDIFNHFTFDLSESKGVLILKLNGAPAKYTDILKDGDSIEIYWD